MQTGKPRKMTFQAVEASVAFHVPLSALTEINTTYPDFRLRLAALSERNSAAVAIKVIADLMIPSTESSHRCGAAAHLHIRPDGRATAALAHLLTQTEIGQMANAPRDRVSRAIAKFEAAGRINSGYKEITITDPISLAQHVSDQR